MNLLKVGFSPHVIAEKEAHMAVSKGSNKRARFASPSWSMARLGKRSDAKARELFEFQFIVAKTYHSTYALTGTGVLGAETTRFKRAVWKSR